MNGQNQFTWDNLRGATLDEIGLSKMTAFRVAEQKESEKSKDNEDMDDKE
eukprot:CAMPEP_0198148576 /NCGR_PEP_ID=MMETSP1443-20131203/42142_1 /TAXON_ID=186043 /ORGANISM="Entomoneis sp., Strain CCMP2396" /LENGTH=49 /DNA_ID=CAMNT_0043813293 /DNA_START=113 /DNA_END=262 /DNA_ORIENTATION=+